MRNLETIYLIAEAGINHNGCLQTARRMIDAAAACGADAVKFQHFKAERLVQRNLPQETYQRVNSGNDERQFEMLRRHELSRDALAMLKEHAEHRRLDFLCTPYDRLCCDELASLGLETVKIGSGEITDLPFLQYVAGRYATVILSTGAATLEETDAAVRAVTAKQPNLILLHCTSCYSTRFEDVHLRAMKTLSDRYGLPVGYSDHTPGISISLAAAARGARVIEKHFTLDRSMPGPDHPASLEPEEFRQMVTGTRQIEAALGSAEKKPVHAEAETLRLGRRSILSRTRIARGQRLTEAMLITKRPATGISPAHLPELLGAVAKHDIEPDSVLTWDDIERAGHE